MVSVLAALFSLLLHLSLLSHLTPAKRVPLWSAKEKGEDTPPPYAPDSQAAPEAASVQLHPLPAKEALLVKVQPPSSPAGSQASTKHHVPCDIVLVIDVSGSMGIRADVPGEEPDESPGLSVLDLTKHAALTIIETLNEGDRLGIVTFSSKSQVVQRLTPMTKANKNAARKNIRNIKKQDATNLWHGLLDGIKLFKTAAAEEDDKAAAPSQRVPALMVLTDGKPNFMCPPVGYVPKLRTMLPLPASIHTFGFGYNLESGLLKSIAEVGGGNYAFIPDAGMIGTVFVHAVANLQNTFATDAVLELSYPPTLQLNECMGEYVGQEKPQETTTAYEPRRLKLKLGNLQYGQSRDIYLKVEGISGLDSHSGDEKKGSAVVTASLRYEQPSTASISGRVSDLVPDVPCATARSSILEKTDLPDTEVAYHESRAQICRFLSSLFPMSSTEVHEPISIDLLADKRDELTLLIDQLPAQLYKDNDVQNRSLVEDLTGKEPRGQISLAVGSDPYFKRWGGHYLLSLLNAHTRQICNSFKDQGPLQYGVNSPLFVECRNRLDNAFDNLPAPEPSLPPRGAVSSGGSGQNTGSTHGRRTAFSMSRYHNPLGICFAGSTPVELVSPAAVAPASRKQSVPIRLLRRGMIVRTPLGPRRVRAVLKTRVEDETLCRVPGGVLVTPWHPISGRSGVGAKQWVFPAQVAVSMVRYTGHIYSVMLQRDDDARAHAIKVGGIWGVTMGHGIIEKEGDEGDVRAHEFFGDYNKVGTALVELGVKKNGVAIGGGVVRDEETGLVAGFRSCVS